MSELKWLDEYSGQTTEELIALEGKYRTDSIIVVFEQALSQKAERVGQEGLTEEERVVLAIEALECEVNNGGYGQFFMNSSNEYVPVVVHALNRIGCAETAKLTQQAIDILRIDGPPTVEKIDRVMDNFDERREKRLGELDDRYYETAGDLADPLFEFIKSNRDKISLRDSS